MHVIKVSGSHKVTSSPVILAPETHGSMSAPHKLRQPCPAIMHKKMRRLADVRQGPLTAGQQVPVLLVGTVANVGHVDAAALELTAHAGVDTLWPPP